MDGRTHTRMHTHTHTTLAIVLPSQSRNRMCLPFCWSKTQESRTCLLSVEGLTGVRPSRSLERVRGTLTACNKDSSWTINRARLLFRILGDSPHAATKRKLVFKKRKRKGKQDTRQTKEETSKVA